MHGVYTLWKPRTRNTLKTHAQLKPRTRNTLKMHAQLIQSFSHIKPPSIKHFVTNTLLRNACAYIQTTLIPDITNLICIDCAQSFENQLHIIFIRVTFSHF